MFFFGDYLTILQNTYEAEGRVAADKLANLLGIYQGTGIGPVIATAYVLLNIDSKKSNLKDISSFCTSMDFDMHRTAFLEGAIAGSWHTLADNAARMKEKFNDAVLKSIILFYEDDFVGAGTGNKTPKSIISLAERLLELENGDEVADFCAGTASFISSLYSLNHELNFHGIELSDTKKAIADIKLEILGCKACIEQSDIFDIDPDTHKYQKIFSNYPLGMKVTATGLDEHIMLKRLSEKTGGLSENFSSDWLFNSAVMECLKENGKAVCIMTSGSAFNTRDIAAREYFIRNGYLRAIISLPPRIFGNTAVSTIMLVLGFNNFRTMVVDATALYDKKLRFNVFNDRQLESIVRAASNESEISRWVTNEELLEGLSEENENRYCISPAIYLNKAKDNDTGIKFGECISSLMRGAPLTAKELVEDSDHGEPSKVRYLMLNNIQKGIIDYSSLPYLKESSKAPEKYFIKNRSLIISKNSVPFKIAVAELSDDDKYEGDTILANGNLYVIKVNEEKADPYFIQAFLESEEGNALLKSIAVGTVIINISAGALKDMKIPNVPLERQRMIGRQYKAKLDDIADCQKRIQGLYKELEDIYKNN